MTWKQLQRGIAEMKLSAINPHDRHIWRSGVRSAMCAASQLSDISFIIYIYIYISSIIYHI